MAQHSTKTLPTTQSPILNVLLIQSSNAPSAESRLTEHFSRRALQRWVALGGLGLQSLGVFRLPRHSCHGAVDSHLNAPELNGTLLRIVKNGPTAAISDNTSLHYQSV